MQGPRPQSRNFGARVPLAVPTRAVAMGTIRELTIKRGPASEEQGSENGAERAEFGLPRRDVRRKRPPLLSFLLRTETLRRVARVVSLLALDFVGVVGALF